jgi:hypothetical protein
VITGSYCDLLVGLKVKMLPLVAKITQPPVANWLIKKSKQKIRRQKA